MLGSPTYMSPTKQTSFVSTEPQGQAIKSFPTFCAICYSSTKKQFFLAFMHSLHSYYSKQIHHSQITSIERGERELTFSHNSFIEFETSIIFFFFIQIIMILNFIFSFLSHLKLYHKNYEEMK